MIRRQSKQFYEICEKYRITPDNLNEILRENKRTILSNPILEILTKEHFIKSEIAHATASKKLKVISVFGNYFPYLPFLIRYSPYNIIVPLAHESPATIYKKYYAIIYLIFEDYSDFDELISFDKQVLLINPTYTQNFFDEINSSSEDESCQLACSLLNSHNSKYPFRIILP